MDPMRIYWGLPLSPVISVIVGIYSALIHYVTFMNLLYPLACLVFGQDLIYIILYHMFFSGRCEGTRLFSIFTSTFG